MSHLKRGFSRASGRIGQLSVNRCFVFGISALCCLGSSYMMGCLNEIMLHSDLKTQVHCASFVTSSESPVLHASFFRAFGASVRMFLCHLGFGLLQRFWPWDKARHLIS